MGTDKLYNKLLELYRTVYSAIGIDFDSVDKVDNWCLQYNIDESAEEQIVEDFLNKNKLSKLEKQVLKFNYYLGVSPKTIKKEEIKI